MCAIVALFKRADLAVPLSLVDDMADRAAHRGPDGFGRVGFSGAHVVHDGRINGWDVALAHRRLSILDLSERAAQPMPYRGRYWLTYNGEVYNYRELRTELERRGHAFRTASDSEVILAAFAEWGPQSFERLRGMWGLVLLDVQTRTAVVCRDRLGMKPLFVWQSGELVVVVSEIKQLLGVPRVSCAARRAGGHGVSRHGLRGSGSDLLLKRASRPARHVRNCLRQSVAAVGAAGILAPGTHCGDGLAPRFR